MEDQLGGGYGQLNIKGGVGSHEGELRQQLNDIERECDQVVARNLNHIVELEGKVRRLAQVIDELQGQRKAPSWRIILDTKSPISEEIMSTRILWDFRFLDLKYSGKTNPLVHIEHFNNIKVMQGLTQA